MKTINLFGSAGAGKSTTALGIAHILKINGYKVEYVSEYAKQLVMSGCQNLLTHQEHVFTNQLFQMNILKDKELDYIVTDSPLLLSAFYGNKYNTSTENLKKLIFEHFNNFDNINYFIERAHEYDPVGRIQSAEESMEDSSDLIQFLKMNDTKVKHVKSHTILSSYIAYDVIFNSGNK